MKTGIVETRTEEELEFMRKSGEITARALKIAIEASQQGRSLVEIDRLVDEAILKFGGGHSFKSVDDYFWSTCLTLNDEVVHGIPRDIKLKDGDVLGIDLGAVYQGWHTDAAWSVLVGQEQMVDEKKEKFLKVGEQTLWRAVDKAVEGLRIGDISSTIQSEVEKAGYSVVKSLCGHGVGKELHEDPEVPGYGQPNTGLLLKDGMTIAIEVIYTAGKGEVYQKSDGWTLAAKDGSLSGLFEMSVVVGKNNPEILTDWRSVSA